ncbi:MAG: hypothetical protein ACOCYP_01235 [Planctomycetota bacterium]
MHHIRNHCGWLCAAILALAATGVGASEDRLKFEGLPAPHLAITPASVSQGGITNGIYRQSQFINLSSRNPSHAFSVAGKPCELALNSGRVVLRIGDRSAPLARAGNALRPVPFELDNGEKFALAFPYYNVSRSVHYLAYCPGFSRSGRLGRGSFSFYDQNQDGAFTIGQDAYNGGKSVAFAPLTEFIVDGKTLLHVDSIAADGTAITTSKYDGDTAELAVETGRGGPGVFCVFTSDDGKVAFATEGGSGDFTVPHGTYKLAYGIAVDRRGTATAVIKPGTHTGVTVTDDAAIAVGGPYSFEFRYMRQGNKVIFSPRGFIVRGANGEVYEDWDFQSPPRLSVVEGNAPRALGSFEYG